MFAFYHQTLPQVGSNLANAVDDGQWSQGLISAVSCFLKLLYKRGLKWNVNPLPKHLLNSLLAAGTYGSSSHQQPVWSSKCLSAGACQRGEANLFSQAGRGFNCSAVGGLQGEGRPGFWSHEETAGNSVTQYEFIHENFVGILCAANVVICLKAAGNAVKRASDNLVKAAQKAAFDKTEDDSVVVKTKFVGGIAQVRHNPEWSLRGNWNKNHPCCAVCPFRCMSARWYDEMPQLFFWNCDEPLWINSSSAPFQSCLTDTRSCKTSHLEDF